MNVYKTVFCYENLKKFFYLLIYLAVLGVAMRALLQLWQAEATLKLHELLIDVASLVAAPGLQSTGSVVVVRGLSCCGSREFLCVLVPAPCPLLTPMCQSVVMTSTQPGTPVSLGERFAITKSLSGSFQGGGEDGVNLGKGLHGRKLRAWKELGRKC